MTELIFNDVSNIDIGILLKNEKIDIPAPERDISEITIPGRDGILHKDNKRYKPISFDAGFNFKDLENTEEVFRKVKRWLRGSGELSLSYDIDYFYKVTNIELNSYKHTHTRVAEFSATFTADPFQYLKVGKAPILNPMWINRKWKFYQSECRTECHYRHRKASLLQAEWPECQY